MSTERKNTLTEVMNLAWQLVKRNGFTISEALKTAWANINLKIAMRLRIVKFYFTKVDGTIREAYGMLRADILPSTAQSNRRPSDTVQIYYDTEKQEYRSFKKANLLRTI